MRQSVYGTMPLEHMAFALAHPVRRFIVEEVAAKGYATALDVQREFPDHNRMTARDIFVVLVKRGVLVKAEYIPDIQGKQRQRTYRFSPTAPEALDELRACLTDISTALELSPVPLMPQGGP